MKRTLSALAVSGLLALGVATSSSASPLSMGAATVNAVKTEAQGIQPDDIVKINHRHGHHHSHHRHRRGHHFGPGPAVPPWYRGHRRHHRHHHGGRPPWFGGPWGNPWRDGSRSNFTLEFNVQPRARQAPRYALSAAHVRWCESRYRSYRVSDDSFQPYNGPRRRCVSPYY